VPPKDCTDRRPVLRLWDAVAVRRDPAGMAARFSICAPAVPDDSADAATNKLPAGKGPAARANRCAAAVVEPKPDVAVRIWAAVVMLSEASLSRRQ
jgi:hypothetical protein